MKIQEKNKYKYLATNHHSKKFKSNWNGLPAFIKRYDIEDSLANHFFYSIFWHIILVLLLCWLFSALKISEMPIFKQKEKIQDIEFVLNNPSKNRPRLSKSNSTPKIEKVNNNTSTEPKRTIKPTKKLEHNNFASIPTAIPDDFSIPVPKIKPMSGSGGLGRRASSTSGASFGESTSSDIGAENGSSSGSGSAKGTGFDKNATRKAVSSYDISPYVNELKRNIRLNWKAPQENKSVELFLRIAKDGRLIILNVKRTSEVGDVDNAALNAVRKTLPLNPLPSKYSKSYLDVIFTFDSSSIGSRY